MQRMKDQIESMEYSLRARDDEIRTVRDERNKLLGDVMYLESSFWERLKFLFRGEL